MALLRLLALPLALSGCVLYVDEHEVEPDARTQPPQPDGPLGERYVFVTSETYQGGALGGLAGADAICTSHARAANLTGTYRAWLSDGTGSAATRISHAGGYRLVGGNFEHVAYSWSDLTNRELLHAIDRDETGARHEAEPSCMAIVGAWTGTNHDGTRVAIPGYDNSCGRWNDIGGNGLLGNTRETLAWSHSGCSTLCTMRAALYCFEQ